MLLRVRHPGRAAARAAARRASTPSPRSASSAAPRRSSPTTACPTRSASPATASSPAARSSATARDAEAAVSSETGRCSACTCSAPAPPSSSTSARPRWPRAAVVDYLVDTVFNYPTLAESYKVAALDGSTACATSSGSRLSRTRRATAQLFAFFLRQLVRSYARFSAAAPRARSCRRPRARSGRRRPPAPSELARAVRQVLRIAAVVAREHRVGVDERRPALALAGLLLRDGVDDVEPRVCSGDRSAGARSRRRSRPPC